MTYMGIKLIASVVDKESGKLTLIERNDYATKKEFKTDLMNNGYSVRFIATEEKFDEECEKYRTRKDVAIRRSKLIWASDKKHAEKMGMTVREYRAWLKG